MIEAELADGRILEFPDGTDPSVIQATVKKVIAPNDSEQQDNGISGVLGDIESAFQKIPGAPQLSEFAAAFNRPVLETLDMLGPGAINTILSAAGSEKRIPGFEQSLGSEGGFLEEGLQKDIITGAGEVAPIALGVGQLLRTMASRLPAVASSESTATGVARQLGQSTAAQDVGLGSLAGGGAVGGKAAGEEIGGETGGEIGEAIGGLAAPIAPTIALSSAKSVATKLLSKAAPSVDELKRTASGIYKSLDESGVIVESKAFDRTVNNISTTLRKEGLDPDLTPKASALVRRLNNEKGVDKSLTEIDTLRKVAKGAADSTEAGERRLGKIVIDKIDDFLDGQDVGPEYRAARDLWHRAKKSETLDLAVVEAESQASGFENGLRTQFRSILKKINNGKLKGYTEEERLAIKKVVEGTNAGNIARFLGKFGILDGITSRSLTTLGGAGLAGAATGSTGAAAAVPLIGQLSGALAQRMTLNNAKMANSIVRAGKQGTRIAEVYIRNTPKAERNSNELAELFLANKVPVNSMVTNKSSPLIADAAVIASIAKMNDNKEDK